ncbi:MAG: hypothetical protein AAF481_13365 [Acidobacteriota bacterium]
MGTPGKTDRGRGIVALGVVWILACSGAVSADLYYETKADYRAGIAAGEMETAGSDTCVAPTVVPDLFEGDNFGDNGTTVGNTNTVGTIPIACNGNYATVAGPDEIYTFTTGNAPRPTFFVTTPDPDYDPSIYLLTTCNDGNSCVAGADSCFAQNAPGNPCGAVSDEFFGPLILTPNAQHFFYVDSFYAVGGTRDAGPFDLVIMGPTRPVELIEFTIE